MLSGSFLLVHATWSASNSTANRMIEFEIQINGTSWRAAGIRVTGANNSESGSLVGRLTVGEDGLVVGSNTINLRWRTASNTAQINPTLATSGRQEHASLLLQQVAS